MPLVAVAHRHAWAGRTDRRGPLKARRSRTQSPTNRHHSPPPSHPSNFLTVPSPAMAHYSHSTSSTPSAASPAPMTSIGIVFHEYPRMYGKVNALWSLVLSTTPDFCGTTDALVYTYADLATPGVQQPTYRRGPVPDVALLEHLIGVLHVADVPLPRPMLATRLLARELEEEQRLRATDNRLWLARTLLEWQRQGLVPPLRWRNQQDLLRGIADCADCARGMWGRPLPEGRWFPVTTMYS
ncbi:hypothetical protein BV25DRAFT_356053 [Artomyces pyxidatus]|uniref:Uncharacterized protein n=1 Tax=Artomyces pyxidatus TaxID=48021 RepID=A0ACB8T4H9_9AGAM|nr:hypothetical protein BV25DRAFT_356053 [Artomyces pyxidatus]